MAARQTFDRTVPYLSSEGVNSYRYSRSFRQVSAATRFGESLTRRTRSPFSQPSNRFFGAPVTLCPATAPMGEAGRTAGGRTA
jgi:hypothetical protein